MVSYTIETVTNDKHKFIHKLSLFFKLADKTNNMQNVKATITIWPKFASNIF